MIPHSLALSLPFNIHAIAPSSNDTRVVVMSSWLRGLTLAEMQIVP